MLLAMEELGDNLVLDTPEVLLETNTTVLQVWNLSAVAPRDVIGLQLTLHDSEVQEANISYSRNRENRSGSDSYADIDAAIMLPGKIGQRIMQGEWKMMERET